MKKILIAISLFLTSNCVSAQDLQLVDSLMREIASGRSGTNTVDAYVLIAREFRYGDSTAATNNIEEALALAKEIKYPEGEVDAMYEFGRNLLHRNHYKKASELFLSSIEMSQKMGYQEGAANGYNGL
ncbi:MAG: hypothetical protein HRT61_21645, partial [Ekhidna sp.]|nr:hypothetical protein [Ekhidna sp.]